MTRMKKKKKKKDIAFIDRDGVLNSKKINKGYIGKISHFRWINGAKKTIKLFNQKGYKVVVVTNQSGVARGYFQISQIKKLHLYMSKQLKLFGAKIDAFYFCPFHIDGVIKKYKKKSNLRKPNNGMFKIAQKRWKINKKNSFMIGDQISDMDFAKKSGIKGFHYKKGNLFEFVKKNKIF